LKHELISQPFKMSRNSSTGFSIFWSNSGPWTGHSDRRWGHIVKGILALIIRFVSFGSKWASWVTLHSREEWKSSYLAVFWFEVRASALVFFPLMHFLFLVLNDILYWFCLTPEKKFAVFFVNFAEIAIIFACALSKIMLLIIRAFLLIRRTVRHVWPGMPVGPYAFLI
jgi:hypothetical protein